MYAIVHDRFGKRVSSLKQLREQNLKRLYNIMMAMKWYRALGGRRSCNPAAPWPGEARIVGQFV